MESMFGDCTDGTPGRPAVQEAGRRQGRADRDGAYLLYNPVGHYNVDICANNEEQAVTPEGPAECWNPRYECAKLKSTTPRSSFKGGNKGVMKDTNNLGVDGGVWQNSSPAQNRQRRPSRQRLPAGRALFTNYEVR